MYAHALHAPRPPSGWTESALAAPLTRLVRHAAAQVDMLQKGKIAGGAGRSLRARVRPARLPDAQMDAAGADL